MRKKRKHQFKRGVHSISTKLVGLIALLIAFISVSIYTNLPALIHKRSLTLTSEKAQSIGDMTAYGVRVGLDFDITDGYEDAFNVAKQNEDLVYMVLKNRNGVIVYSYEEMKASVHNYEAAKYDSHVTDDELIYRAYTPVMHRGKKLGELYLGLSLRDLQEDIATFKSRIMYGTILVILFGIISAIFIARVVTKPLNKLVSTFESISKGDLTKRAEIESQDEIGQLGESFNLMVESLEFAINELENSNKNLQLEITERKRAEEELRKLSQALMQSPVAIMITNINKVIEYVNPKFEQFTGYTYNEIVGKKSSFLMESENDPSRFNNLWTVINGGKVWKGEFFSKRKDGSSYWEFISISALTNTKGEKTHFITVKEDITERKLLEESREKYEFIVNSSKDLVTLVNNNYKLDAVNTEFCNVLGVGRNDLIGQHLYDVMPRDDFFVKVKEHLDNCFKGIPGRSEISYEFENRGSIYLEINYYPFKDEKGNFTHAAIFAKDISEKREAQLILKESEVRYRELVSNLPDMVIVQQFGKVIFANGVVGEQLGYTADEVIGMDVFDFIAPEYRAMAEERRNDTGTGAMVPSSELELVKKNGERLFVEIRGARITYSHKPAILNVVVNITERKRYEAELKSINEQLEQKVSERTAELLTAVEQLKREVDERKQAEESLRTSEEKFRALAESSTDSIMRFDKNLNNLYANSAISKLTGIPADEFIGKNIYEIDLSTVIKEKLVEAIEKALPTSKPYRTEFMFEEGKWLDVIVAPERTYSSRINTFLISARDISDLKHNEAELITAKEKALESSRLKSEFLANMSHEIRTPMNAIIGFTDVLNGYLYDDKQKHYLRSIKSAGNNLLTLINDILDLSKIEAGKLELNYEAIDPYAFMNEIKNMFALRIAEKNLEFIVEVDEDLPRSLLLDEVRLRQILFNLIGNAVKFTESGFIKISMNKIFTEQDRSKVNLILAVEDSGIGIQRESQEAIFESFRQQEGQSTKKYGGTGLGLAITRRLVEMMHGKINVKSEPGNGSTFEIILKSVSAASAPAKVKATVKEAHDDVIFEPAKILVVDDVEVNRVLIFEYYTNQKFEFIEAEHGEEAIAQAKMQHPDLILMDIRMPVMNGYEAIRRLKSDPKVKDIPVIAITASAMKEDKQKIDDAGFDGYLMKPVQYEDLTEELKRFIGYVENVDETKARKTEDEGVKEDILTPEIAKKVMAEYDDETSELYDKALQNHFLNDVMDFAERIKAIGNGSGYSKFEKYGTDLLYFAQNFDIENMGTKLNEFSKLIDEVKKLA